MEGRATSASSAPALTKGRPRRVLVVNDDGVFAPGLTKLVAALGSNRAIEVFVAAPDRERSATSHCITLGSAVTVQKVEVPGATAAYAVSGKPADCTMLALTTNLFSDAKFDLVVSGINRGNNAGLHVVYSGTVAGAREAACKGIPAIASSLDSGDRNANYDAAAAVTVRLVHAFLSMADISFLAGYVVNINTPPIALTALKGYLMTRQSWECTLPCFVEMEMPAGQQANGRRSFRNVGGGLQRDRMPGTDTWAMSRGFVAVTLLATLNSMSPPESVLMKTEPPQTVLHPQAAMTLVGDLFTTQQHMVQCTVPPNPFSLQGDPLGVEAAGEVLKEFGDYINRNLTPETRARAGEASSAATGVLQDVQVRLAGVFESMGITSTGSSAALADMYGAAACTTGGLGCDAGPRVETQGAAAAAAAPAAAAAAAAATAVYANGKGAANGHTRRPSDQAGDSVRLWPHVPRQTSPEVMFRSGPAQ